MAKRPSDILELLKPVLACPARSKARGSTVKSAAAKAGVSTRVVEKWAAKFERSRTAAVFARKPRSDKGVRRVCVSKVYDQALLPRVGRDGLMAIERDLHRQIRRALNSPITSANEIKQVHVEGWLMAYTRDLGTGLTDEELRSCCKVVWTTTIRPHRHVRVAHVMKTNAQKFANDYVPRIRRSRKGLWFNAIICIDCTAVDVLCRDADGRLYTARAIVIQDLATNTLLMEVLFPRKGEGITQRHVGQAILRWCEMYGPPGAILTDHGSEFRKLDLLDDLFKLSARVGVEQFLVLNAELEPELKEIITQALAAAKRNIRRAAKYNPQGKPVEGQNALIMRFMLATIHGFIGNDRTRQPTRQKGRQPDFHSDPAALVADMNLALATYDGMTQKGHLEGKSPRQTREELKAKGYVATGVNVEKLRQWWSDKVPCTISKGGITIRNLGRYSCDATRKMLNRTRVMAWVPFAGDLNHIAIFDDRDQFIGHATPQQDEIYFLSPAGASHQRALASAQRTAIAAIDAEIEPYDVSDGRRRFVEMLAPEAPQRRGDVIQLGKEVDQIPPAKRELPAPKSGSTAADVLAERYVSRDAAPATKSRKVIS